MTVYYLVEHVSYAPSDEYDFKNEIAVPSNELDDRTFKARSFKTEDEARKYISEIKKSEGIYLAEIFLFKVIKELIDI